LQRVRTLNNPTPTFVTAYDNQDERFSSAFSVLKNAIADRAFPAASVAVTHADKLVALRAFGRFTYEELGAPPFSRSSREEPALSEHREPKGGDFDLAVTPATLFDLASVTKAVATTTMAMLLYERGLLELETPVIGVVPEFMADSCGEPDSRRRDVTFRMLLAHSSGLPAYEKLFLQAHSRDDLLRAAFITSLSTDPGTHAEYSDIGFIVLGAALERIAGESLDPFCQREIFAPLGMVNTTFNPPQESRATIPPTADERYEAGACATPRSTFRQRIIQGEVQDENASVLGGVAGQAGLFSTAEDLARFAQTMMQGGSPILRPDTVTLFTRRESAPTGTSRALGWDTPSTPSQSGTHFGPGSFGHLGYTGTSLWIAPDRQLSITLLTNRTWPDCANQCIRQVRPKFHEAVVEALNKPT
jgi:CubicO group peptidase (beta-lactamase class C family)